MIKENLKNVPTNPGVYIMYNEENTVIYVGKAKNLKNRVSQYFQNSNNHTAKVLAMVENIHHFEYIITETEFEALVLECNFIKQYMPKYNILLKDDKNHPYIKITINEEYPRIILARKIENDNAKYFGPYISTYVVRETIDLIKNIFNVRSCNRILPRDIGKSRPCLNYQIKKCSAPCYNCISQKDYKSTFSEIISFLEGKHSDILAKLESEMLEASQRLEFERAAKTRDKIISIRQISEKQRVISTAQGNSDVIAFAKEDKNICLQIFFIRNGKVIGREHYIIKNEQGSQNDQIMTYFIKQYYGMIDNIPSDIILQYEVEDKLLLEKWLSKKCGSRIEISIPKRGDKLGLIKMAERNAIETLKLHLLKSDIAKRKMNDLILEIKKTFGLDTAPMRIEAYDISNISGTDSVGACVVFENGRPKKSDYKKFNIRSTKTPDDYQSMKEVLYRRLSNGLENQKGFTPMPDLILIDGGKGHISAVKEIMSFLKVDIPVYGMVKDDNHKTRGVTTENDEIGIKRTSVIFKFLTEVQDEVHRFAITSHRTKHKKSAFESELSEINGVGDKKRAILLKHFKSLKAIKEADYEEICIVKGIDKKTAKAVYDFYHKENLT